MSEKMRSIALGVVWLVCSTLRGQDLAETLSSIAAGEGAPEVVAKALVPWLDEAGFDRLKEALDATAEAKKRAAPEWLAVAWVEEQLQRPKQALAAWKKACASPPKVTAHMQLGLAHALARLRQFDEAVKVLEEMDVAKADAHSVQEAAWLLHSLANESGQRANWQTLPQRMAEQRPDDAELKLLLARLAMERGSSEEAIRSAKEALSQAKDAQVKLAWLLVVLDNELQQGMNLEATKDALQGLRETAPNSEDEWQLLRRLTRALHQGRRNPSKAVMPTEEEVAGQFKDRPVAVRRMAVCLRAAGATAAAHKVLDLIKEDAATKKLISDWQEEDGNEPQPLVRATMAKVSPVEDAGNQAVAPAWEKELNQLGREARLKRLLEVWKADPRDQAAALQLIDLFLANDNNRKEAEMLQVVLQTNFACADSSTRQAWWRQLALRRSSMGYRVLQWWQSMRWRMDEKVAFLDALVPTQSDSFLPALREAVRREPENERTKMDLARALWRSGYEKDALHLLEGMTTAHGRAAARLEIAFFDLIKGRPHAAIRTMFELAGDAALEADMAATLGTGLMAWREWANAAEFLAAQRQRFPADYRLAALHGLALQGAGEQDKAGEVLLKMGEFVQEMPPTPDDGLFEVEDLVIPRGLRSNTRWNGLLEWMQVQEVISDVLRENMLQEQWIALQQQRQSGYYRTLLTPQTVSQAAAWGMARLLVMLAEKPEAERQVWVEKARAAKLPMPELLVAGKLTQEQDRPTQLTLDPPWIEKHLDLPWVGALWLQQTSRQQPKDTAAAAVLALKVSRAHLEAHASTALSAALLAWRLAPQDSAALDAVVAALAHGKSEDAAELISLTGSDLGKIPLEARRKAAPQLVGVLTALSQKVTDSSHLRAMHEALMHGALWLGAWELAAQQAEAALAAKPVQPSEAMEEEYFSVKSQAERRLLSPAVVLSWPVQNGSTVWYYLTVPQNTGGKSELFTAEEKAAFLAAGAKIQDWSLKLQWQIAGGDEPGARKLVPAWLRAQPENRDAVLAAAGLAAAEQNLPHALDLLHARLVAQTKPEDRLMAQIDYLLAGTYQGDRPSLRQSQTAEPLTTPPAAHLKRLRKVAAELLPRLQKVPQGYRAQWAAIYQGLEMQAEADTLRDKRSQQAERELQLWSNSGRAYFDTVERAMGERETSVSIYEISRLLENQQATAPAVELLVRSLRQDADKRFFGLQDNEGQLEQWQRIIRQQALAKSVLAAVEPGKAPTWRKLALAVHAAEACEAWEQVIAWGTAALKLEAGNQAMKQALAAAHWRSNGDPAALVEALKALPPAEGNRSLTALLKTAQKTPDFDQRLKLAGAVVRLAGEQPAILSPTNASNKEALSGTFALLSEAVNDRDGHSVAPAIYAEFAPRQSANSKQQPSIKPASAAQLETRKKLFVEFCDLSMQHPAWIRETLHHLLARYMVENQPDAAALADYIKQGLAEQPQQSFVCSNELSNFERRIKDGGLRLRLARLGLLMLDTFYGKASTHISYAPLSEALTKLIGAEIPAAKHPPLWALWECPLDATTGQYQHTPEQLALNHERRALMDQFWQASEPLPQLRWQLFPAWAAYRLHLVDKIDEVLAVARVLSAAPGDRVLLRGFMDKAVLSYENPHHVLAAELVEALLRDQSAKLNPEEVAEPVGRIIRVLTLGRKNQADPMPPLSAAPEEAEKLLSLDLQKRRRAVLSRLTELLGKEYTTTPELIFSQFEEALRQNQDVEIVIGDIVKLAQRQPQQIRQALVAFIQAGNGKHLSRGDTYGYSGGAWQLDLRLRWFSATLELGKRLVKSDAKEGDSQFEWLRSWIAGLSEPNLLAEPPVPPPNGTELRQRGIYGSTALQYAKQPLVKKRDELLLKGVELAMQQSDLWLAEFGPYTELQMVRTPPGTRQLLAVLDKHCANRPELYIDALNQWDGARAFGTQEARLAGASIMMKALDAWHKNQVTGDFSRSIDACRKILLGARQSGKELEIPLVTDMPWMFGYNATSYDWALKQPGAKERHAAWVRVVNKALTIPSMFSTVFADAAQLHVAKEPEKIIAAAKKLSFEDWRRVQSELVQLFGNEERNASVERRLQWGRLVVQLLPLAAAVDNYAPQESNKPTWVADTLKFLQQSPSDSSVAFRAPPPTGEILTEREALIQQLRALILDEPSMAVEGLVSFAHQQFVSGATPEATLALARKSLKHDAAQLGRQLNAWCSEALRGKEVPHAERVWALEVLLPLAEEWPQENANWLNDVSYLLNSLVTSGMATESVKPLAERLMNAAMKLPPNGWVLANFARMICTTKEGQQQFTERLKSLLAKDRLQAAAWMNAWWKVAGAGPSVQVAQPALDLLKAWPADASTKELEWGASYIKALAIPADVRDPYHEGITLGGEQKPRKVPPAPGPDAESRRLQQESLQELRRRQVDLPGMLPLELRLAGHSTLEPKARVEGLRPFFAEPLLAQTLAYCTEVTEINLVMQSVRQNGDAVRPVFPGERVPRHGDADEILEVSRFLLTAAQQAWLSEAVLKPLRDKSLAHLPILIGMAARRTASMNSSPSNFIPRGVLESQAAEARALLDAWDTEMTKNRKSAVTPVELPRDLLARLKAGEKSTALVEPIWKLLKEDPAATSAALQQWALSLNNQQQPLPAFLEMGQLAALLAERWTTAQPAPDWLVALVLRWNEGAWADTPSAKSSGPAPGAMARGFPPGFRGPPPRILSRADSINYQQAAKRVMPRMAAALRRFPGCKDAGYFQALLMAVTKVGDDMPPQELSRLAVAHLQASPHSIRRILLPYADENNPSRWNTPPAWQDAVAFLLDQAQQSGEHGELPPEQRQIIRAALEPEVTGFYDALETLATCTAADFPKAAEALLKANPDSRTASCILWILRSAERKKADVPAARWMEITHMKENFHVRFNQDGQLPSVLAWLRHRASQKKSNPMQDVRDLLRELLGKEYSREKMLAALSLPSPRTGVHPWQGWPMYGDAMPYQECRWVYHLMETMTAAPELFSTNLELAYESGVAQHPGALAWLMIGSRTRAWYPEYQGRWQDWLLKSTLLDDEAVPDARWLLPRDGLAPVWEFAKACGLGTLLNTSASAWLQEQQSKQPTVGRALLLLACQRGNYEDIPVAAIEATLAPCRAQLQKASTARRAALTAALGALQPSLEAAVQAAPPQSVLQLLPPASVPPDLEALARRWMTGDGIPASDPTKDVETRMKPLAAVLLRLLQSGVKQTPAVMAAGVKALAAEKWEIPKAAQHLGTESWVQEHLGQVLLNTAGDSSSAASNGRITVSTESNDDGNRHLKLQAILFLLQNSRQFSSSVLSSSWKSQASALFTHGKNTTMTGTQLYALLTGMLPPKDHGEALLALKFLGSPSPSMPALEQLATTAQARQPGSTLAWASQNFLQTRKAALTGATAPALTLPAAFWNDESISDAVLLEAIEQSNAPPPAALRVRALQAWALQPLLNNQDSVEARLLNHPLKWLNEVEVDAPLGAAADELAAALTVWLLQESRSYYILPTGSEAGLGQRVIRPLLAALQRAGKQERRVELMQAAAAKSRLPLEPLLEDWRAAADVPQAVRDWLPRYFHERMNASPTFWDYPAKDLPQLTRKDEAWLACLSHTADDSLPKLIASLVLTALPDSTTDTPTVARAERVKQRLAVLDLSKPNELTALNCFLRLPGCAEELLPELLPALRQHPFVLEWQAGMQLPAQLQRSTQASEDAKRRARTITLWAAAEALHAANRLPWTQWTAAIAKASTAEKSLASTEAYAVRSHPQVIQPPSVWEQQPAQTTAQIIDHYLAQKAVPPAVLLPMWEELRAVITDIQSDGAGTALGARLAQAANTPFDTQAARKRLTNLICTLQNFPRVLESAGFCGLNAAEKWQVFKEIARNQTVRPILLATAVKTGLVTPAELSGMIGQLSPTDGAEWADAATDWLDATDAHAECTAFIRKLASLDSAKLTPRVWHLLLQHATVHDAPDLVALLQTHWEKAIAAAASKVAGG